MKILLKIILGASASVFLYLAVFAIFKKPISLGHLHYHNQNKLAYAKEISHSPKIVIIGGSNGMYSYSCKVIAKQTGVGCVNSSVTVGFGIDYILEKSKEYLKAGDTALLTLEYEFYDQTKKTVDYSLSGNNYIYQYDKNYITKFDKEKSLATVFSFELTDIFTSIVETAIDVVIKEGKFINKVTKEGDIANHTVKRGKVFEEYIKTAKAVTPPMSILTKEFYSGEVIKDFLQWSEKNNVTVAATLPTIFDDKEIDEGILNKIKSIYGDSFIATDTFSMYKRNCFYDTPYHLNKDCQIKHSVKISEVLKQKFSKK